MNVKKESKPYLKRKSGTIIMVSIMLLGLLSFVGGGSNEGQEWVPSSTDYISEEQPLIRMKASDNNGLLVDFEIPGMITTKVIENGTHYQKIEIPNEGLMSEVGKPQLPVIRRYLEVPNDVHLSVNIEHSEFTDLSGYEIYPAQEPIVSMVTNETPEFAIDSSLYSKDDYYPSDNAFVEKPVVFRGHRIVSLDVYPVQYNPVLKRIKLYSKIEVRIDYDQPAQIEEIEKRLISEPFEKICKAFILNYKAPKGLLPAPTRNKDGTYVDYLIITNDTFLQEITPLKDWKLKKGLSTKVVSTREISINNVTAADIKDYIQDAYDNWARPPTYVLLVGDSEFIPANYVTPHPYSAHGGNLTPTDLYYGTVDGTTSAGADDIFADIFVGRLSVDTPAQTTTIVNKILDYERNPSTNANYYANISLCAYFQDNDANDTEDIHAYVSTSTDIYNYVNNLYNVERIYSTNAANPDEFYNKTKLPNDLLIANGFLWNGNTADIRDAINNGLFLINHNDHGASRNLGGGIDGWDQPRYTTVDVPFLKNIDKLPVVFSINCMTGWFDGETDEHPTRNFESFCEEILRHPDGGAVAAIGSTRVSYTLLEFDIDKGLFDAIWPDFDPSMTTGAIYELGPAMTYSKVYMAKNWGIAGIALTQAEQYNLFGDPEMSIWTRQPTPLTVSHPATIGSGSGQEFAVKVTDNLGPVANAKVCILNYNDVYEVGYTDPDGLIIFDVSTSSPAYMNITVTKHNRRPYEGKIEVTSAGAHISVSPNVGPEGISFTITGSDFDGTEEIDIDFGDESLETVAASVGSFSKVYTVPDVSIGHTNVIAIGQNSSRAAVDVFRMLPDQPLPDPYLYCQWDESTWDLNPGGGNPVWNNPSIQLYEGGTAVSSGDLVIGSTYTIKATVHNSGTVSADGTEVTFKWAKWGAGQKTWHLIGTDTINVPASPGTMDAEVLWSPPTTGHVCLVAEIHHTLDSDLDNNLGQENTDVAPISSPGVVTFPLHNPTNDTVLVYLEVTQSGGGTGQRNYWGSRLSREIPQILGPGEEQIVTFTIEAPDGIKSGESRVFTVTARIGDEVIGGVDYRIVKDRPPELTEPTVSPDPVNAGGMATFTMKYTDADNDPPQDGYPKLAVFHNEEAINGSPFATSAVDPGDTNYADGKSYSSDVALNETSGNYTYFFYAYDSKSVMGNGSATEIQDGPLISEIADGKKEEDSPFIPMGVILASVIMIAIVHRRMKR